MVSHGWDWNSSPPTISKLQFSSRGWWNFWLRSLRFTPSLNVYRLNQPFHISLTLPISHYKYNEWLDKVEIGVWALKWSPQTCFVIMSEYKFGLAQTHLSHPDWVSTGWFGQFTASQPFQLLILSIMKWFESLRFEVNLHDCHYTRSIES